MTYHKHFDEKGQKICWEYLLSSPTQLSFSTVSISFSLPSPPFPFLSYFILPANDNWLGRDGERKMWILFCLGALIRCPQVLEDESLSHGKKIAREGLTVVDTGPDIRGKLPYLPSLCQKRTHAQGMVWSKAFLGMGREWGMRPSHSQDEAWSEGCFSA